ncbi:MAG: acetyl-CoA hydrolase/transferase family protein [Dehalococcoidia bacterium]
MADPSSEAYAARLMSAAEAVSVVQPGHRVIVPIGSNPFLLADALAARLAGALADSGGVEIAHCAAAGKYAWFTPGFPGVSAVVHEHWGSPSVRAQLRAHQHDYLPMPFALRFKGQAEQAFRTPAEARTMDVALVQVSPPDEHGYLSLGMAWNQAGFVDSARWVLGEVSTHIPRCYGQNLVHVSKFHALVLNDSPRYSTTVIEPSANHRTIAAHVAEIVRDGDTLQIGAGIVPSALTYAGAFDGKRDLGWHSEATTGRVIDLIRAGVINGERKSIDRGKAVAAGYVGSEEQIAFLRMNPRVEVHPTDYVHNLRVIAGQENMVAINAGLAVDLTGQITAEALGHELFGGTGGQTEFVIGAVSAKHGRSITVLESTALAGSESRMLAEFPAGTAVTIPRIYADMVVTEYGVARLWGKTLRERAAELIRIAHPRFRDELTRASSSSSPSKTLPGPGGVASTVMPAENPSRFGRGGERSETG